jgi:uncharacterized protein YdeI (YjbR/CyaY-like superfamily)
MDATFFESPSELRQWLADNHDKASELLVGFYKKNSHKKGITYAEMLDEALRFGWIDGVRRTIDEARWTIRLTPRKPGSIGIRNEMCKIVWSRREAIRCRD